MELTTLEVMTLRASLRSYAKQIDSSDSSVIASLENMAEWFKNIPKFELYHVHTSNLELLSDAIHHYYGKIDSHRDSIPEDDQVALESAMTYSSIASRVMDKLDGALKIRQ